LAAPCGCTRALPPARAAHGVPDGANAARTVTIRHDRRRPGSLPLRHDPRDPAAAGPARRRNRHGAGRPGGGSMTSRPATLGELKASGYRPRTVKDEMRANLLRKLRSGETLFPGIDRKSTRLNSSHV